MLRTTVTALILSTLVYATVLADSPQRVDYAGHKLVRVDVRSQQDLDALKKISSDVWNDHVGLMPLDVRIPPDRMDDLQASGLSFKILSDDIGPMLRQHLDRPALRGDFDNYKNFSELVAYINNLAATRPDLCNVVSIGTSLQGRDIWVLHITGQTPDPKPGVFYHGLQHCREWITAPVVLYLANHLVSNYDTDPCVADLVNRTHFYLAPCVNPDGYVYTWSTDRLWRKNRRQNWDGSYGVDLNRNWAYGWGGGGSSGTPSDPTYRGPSAFSEPETQVLSSFILNNPHIAAYMDYHSYSQLLLWPFGYENVLPPEPDRTTFETVGLAMAQMIEDVHGEYYEAGPIYSTIYQASGGSVDWVYGQEDRLAYTIELRPSSPFPGFELPPSEILPTCQENLPAILHLSQWAANDLTFDLAAGMPDRIVSGSDTVVALDISAKTGLSVSTAKMHYRYDPQGTFIEVPLTPMGGSAYQAVLPATNCLSSPEFYFTATSSAGQQVTSPCGAPATVHTADVIGATAIFFEETMDAAPIGWTPQGLWAYGRPTGGGGQYGGPDPTSGYTGLNVYGYNLSGDYENSLPERHLTSPRINCTGKTGVTLSFYRWLGVETSTYDHARLRVSSNGTTWQDIWQNTGEIEDASWLYQEFDVSQYADNQPTFYVRWTMGTTDSSWQYCGWNIDDVRLTSAVCDVVKGDWNGDTVVDAQDLAAFPPCVQGPADGIGIGCAIFDFDDDGNVDLEDFAAFQGVFSE